MKNEQSSQYPRGYQKISAAAKALNIDFRNKTILDIGSSTGGFTQYALDHGAKKVIAVEKGTNQMRAPHRFDPRIQLHEKTSIFDFPIPPVDLVLIDVSFVSLRRILSYLISSNVRPLENSPASGNFQGGRACEKSDNSKSCTVLAMFKPQFEAHPDQLTKGIIKNEKIRRQIIKNFESWLKSNNFVVIAKRDNNLPGRHGNLERFYLVKYA